MLNLSAVTSRFSKVAIFVIAYLKYFIHYIQSVRGGKVSNMGVVSVILKKKVYMYMCHIPNGFRDRVISLYNSKIVYKKDITQCFWYRYLLFKWQSWYNLPSIIHFRKFHRQHQCTLQVVWGHGVSLVCTVYSVLYSEITLFRKPFGIGHMGIYIFLLRMVDTLTS
jgi:hypothetical protein